MKKRTLMLSVLLVVSGSIGGVAYVRSAPTVPATDTLPPFEFQRTAAARPDAAAIALFRGVSAESPKHFVQHLLLGVCDGSIDTLQKFAEALHTTEFTHDEESHTFYELRDQRRGFNSKKPPRVIASEAFDAGAEEVMALRSQMISTYYAETFMCFDVASESYDGVEWTTRIVVAEIDGGWYAIPRCRSARSFYKIADAMNLRATAAERPQP